MEPEGLQISHYEGCNFRSWNEKQRKQRKANTAENVLQYSKGILGKRSELDEYGRDISGFFGETPDSFPTTSEGMQFR